MLGFLNINKPAGMTAHDVVYCVRKIMAIKRVGHGGTLDPAATGVLPVAVGGACRLLRYLDGRKVYLADILLGKTTTTDDLEGEIIGGCDEMPSDAAVAKMAGMFQGELSQIPPVYSAVHHQGERLYKLARQGRAPTEISPRAVTVYSLEIVEIALPVVRVRIDCGPGTYIRSIARDLGAKLGCGGCLQLLTREKSGAMELSHAVTLAQLEQLRLSQELEQVLLTPQAVLNLPAHEVTPDESRLLLMGRSLALAEGKGDGQRACLAYTGVQESPAGWQRETKECLCPDEGSYAEEKIGVTCEGRFIAVCRRIADNRLQPEVVIADAD